MDSREYVEKLAGEKAAEIGAFLVDVIVHPGKKILVLADKPSGITIAECAAINRFLQEELEPSGLLEMHELEVSSPGLDQPLKTIRQYEKYTGRRVKVISTDGTETTGMIGHVEENGIFLKQSDDKKNKGKVDKQINQEKETFLPFNKIKETKIVISFK